MYKKTLIGAKKAPSLKTYMNIQNVCVGEINNICMSAGFRDL
jgi:hypothetical protein